MPDTTARNPGFPRDWSDAFNALPLEAPPRDAWSRLAPHLGTRRRPRHLPAWLGLAAAAAVVAVIAWPHTGPDTHDPIAQVVGATEVATKDPPQQEDMAEPTKAVAASAAPTSEIPTREIPMREIPASSNQPSIARLYEPQQASARLHDLQQESARLEALLAVARDERVGSASAVLLADAFEAQVAGIDAALTAADLSDEAREQLWQARVDALQQAAGFVGTQRLLAAQGQTDVLLVSID